MKAAIGPMAGLALVLGTLSGLAELVLTTQPRDQAVPYGGTTTLFAGVEGSQPVNYQWFRNVTNALLNATNATLVISNATSAAEGVYHVRVSQAGQAASSQPARLTVFTSGLAPFGTVTLASAFELNGQGTDVDSIAFWEAPNPTDTLMFVTAKRNDLVEVWEYPFEGHERAPLRFQANVNGIAVDQEHDLLYVTDRIVSVFSLPDLQLVRTFGQGIIGAGENNVDILKSPDGQTIIYVSEDRRVHRFDAGSAAHLGSFTTGASSIETVLADDYHQLILVPEEQGPGGNPGVFAYQPDGTAFLRDGNNRFGQSGVFDSDEEGIALYTLPARGPGDNGAGFIVVSDQRSDVTEFELFDRQSWTHLGALRLEGVSNTDGIASTQQAMPAHPLGLFAAINDDSTAAVIGWEVILRAVGFNPLPRVLGVTPGQTATARGQNITFTVEFSEPVTNFNDAADLLISHFGTTHAGVSIAGSNTVYQLTMSGIGGEGYLLVAINPGSDIRNLDGQPLASSVTSIPVYVRSPYQAWAGERGLISGQTDDPAADPDHDGTSNLEEFATDHHPLESDVRVKERLAVRELGGQRYFTYTFPVRTGAVFAGTVPLSATVEGISYTLSGGMDVAQFDRPLMEIEAPPNTDLPAPNSGWIYRTFGLHQPFPGGGTGFIRRRISGSIPGQLP